MPQPIDPERSMSDAPQQAPSRWVHPDHGGRTVRLGYCTNVHPGETLDEVLVGLREISLPLAERLAAGARLGVGLHLPASVAARLASEEGTQELHSLLDVLDGGGLDAFTYNAFPYGDFHSDGLKADVYRPTWAESEREQYTLHVGQVASAVARARPASDPLAHLAISTHPGTYSAWVGDRSDLKACAEGLARAVCALSKLEGPPLVLSLEAEPFASASNSRALAEFLVFAGLSVERCLREDGCSPQEAAHLARTRLGTCLDACHSAVEFESPEESVALASRVGVLGKIQYSSALSLPGPATHEGARRTLLDLDEPRYLHQVRGRLGDELLGAEDLPQLAQELGAGSPAWLDCEEWRCHFHVPVDLDQVEDLTTTRAHAEALLGAALAEPEAWPSGELHVEVETYTWAVLPDAARGQGALLDGLARELQSAAAVLQKAGWRPA